MAGDDPVETVCYSCCANYGGNRDGVLGCWEKAAVYWRSSEAVARFDGPGNVSTKGLISKEFETLVRIRFWLCTLSGSANLGGY